VTCLACIRTGIACLSTSFSRPIPFHHWKVHLSESNFLFPSLNFQCSHICLPLDGNPGGGIDQLRPTHVCCATIFSWAFSAQQQTTACPADAVGFHPVDHNELIWLNEQEEIETSRSWSSNSLDVAETERYHEVGSSHFYTNVISFRSNIKDCQIIPLKWTWNDHLMPVLMFPFFSKVLMGELEKRKSDPRRTGPRGDALIAQHHPASSCIEAYMAVFQTQCHWLLQLTLCLETHYKHATLKH